MVGTSFGSYGTLPDLRGEFIRGWDHSRGINTGRIFGSWEIDMFKQHDHLLTSYAFRGYGLLDNNTTLSTDPYHLSSSARTGMTGGSETRPRNVALLPCIKY